MKLRLRRRWWLVISLGLGLAGAGLVTFFSLPWLLITRLPNEPTQLPTADVIIHGAISQQTQTDEWIAQLYRQGKAQTILCVSGPVSWDVYTADYARQHLIALGVPAERVLSLRLPQEECFAPNAQRLADYVKAQGWPRALMVVRPAESYSVGSRAEKYFQRAGLQLTLTYPQADYEELVADWWKTHRKAQLIIQATVIVLLDAAYAECW
jgi:uncharacterized SAM-binding protein YcdF (DUF218 family)